MPSYHHDGLRFDYQDEGSGDPVVLLHGFPADSSCWNAVVPVLNRAGLRTLAPDQRGYSPGAVPNGRRAYRIGKLVGDVIALLDELGLERAHVVGHDWGGGVAWSLAERHPDRVASLTSLSTPHPASLLRALRRADQRSRSWYILAFQTPLLPEQLLSRRLPKVLIDSGLQPVAAARYAERFKDPKSLTGPMNWYRAMPFAAEPGFEQPGPVHVPTTYLWGHRDPYLGPQAAYETVDFVTGDFRFEEVDAGHWLPENDAELCAEAIIDRVRRS